MKKKTLNLLLINSTTYDPAFPARPSIIELYGKYFVSLGHNITWINPGNTNEIKKTKFNDVDIYVVPDHVFNSFFKKGFNIISHFLKKSDLIENLIKDKNFDLIQTRNSVFDGLLALKIRKKYNIPFVYQLTFINTGNNFNYTNKSAFSSIYQKIAPLIHNYILRKADIIFPISVYMKNYLKNKNLDEQKIFPLPMGVNIKTFFPNQNIDRIKSKYNLQDKKVFIYVGTMAKKRHLDILIRAFSLVKKEVKNVKLLMVGDGSGKEELEKLTRNLNLEKDIIFTGAVPYVEVPKYICLGEIGLSPIPPFNIYKMSSPTKLLEYMASGIPVIGNREILEIRKVISKSNGGILVNFDVKSFAAGMITLGKEEELAKIMGEKGREWVIKNRSYEQMAKKVEKIYIQLIENYIPKF